MTIRSGVLVLTVLGAAARSAAAGDLAFGDYPSVEFSPAAGQVFVVPVELGTPASLTLTIHTPDGHPIRTLRSDGTLAVGAHSLVWDGRDSDGAVVPDEAYLPVLEGRFADGTTAVIDPRDTSGGETIDGVPVRIVESDIEYRLPKPARALVRVGVAGGPMLRELASWEARPAGSNVQRWDGYDESGRVLVVDRDGLRVLVAAFALPKHSIIVSGGKGEPYLAYAAKLPEVPGGPAAVAQPLSRGDQRISRFHYQSRAMSRPPTVELSFTNGVTTAERDGGPSFTAVGPMTIRVDVPPEDRWLLQRSQYEIAFFVDDEFVSEEESGYVPLTWIYDPSGLAPGRHLLTVNLSGFQGQVGVATVAFDVPGADE